MKKKILFITGTRADYGKIKSILTKLENSDFFSPYIYVCGMHLLKKFGSTFKEILKDGYKNIIIGKRRVVTNNMAQNVANLIIELGKIIKKIKIDMIVVHGDRTDALGGAIVGALNNIRVSHIEGGEISGTIDESMRHAISKLANYHFVSNLQAKKRLIQMGENSKNIYVIGSPDIDLMFSSELPSLENAKSRYGINFRDYAILMFHPVTTEYDYIERNVSNICQAIKASELNYIVIYPNNDLGNNIILKKYNEELTGENYKIFPSIRFEYFLTFLKNAKFIIGNSSCGIREAGVYGVTSIDIGSRQSGRFSNSCKNIMHTDYSYETIYKTITSLELKKNKYYNNNYGEGKSSELFYSIILDKKFWETNLQKRFIDID